MGNNYLPVSAFHIPPASFKYLPLIFKSLRLWPNVYHFPTLIFYFYFFKKESLPDS